MSYRIYRECLTSTDRDNPAEKLAHMSEQIFQRKHKWPINLGTDAQIGSREIENMRGHLVLPTGENRKARSFQCWSELRALRTGGNLNFSNHFRKSLRVSLYMKCTYPLTNHIND